MSSHSRSQSESAFDVEELLEIGARCRELRKEKDMLKESQSQSFELIRLLENHVTSLSTGRTEDKKHIETLEKELMNCSQEIDYLQDHLNARNTEVDCLEEHIRYLELKLADMETLQKIVERLREELKKSSSECLFLIQELENKEVELHNSSLCIENLRESVSSITLDSQCEIESMKLDIVALEQNYFEAEKVRKEALQEKARTTQLIRELEGQFQDAQKVIEHLEWENEELREKLKTSDTNFRTFSQKLEKRFAKDASQLNVKPLFDELESKFTLSEEMSTCEEIISSLVSKFEMLLGPNEDIMDKMQTMAKQIEEYELMVEQLKEELREEKLKAKDEAEDLAQEMAELRYHITGLLEEERERRACIEQASLHRIAELEAQVHWYRLKKYKEEPWMQSSILMEHRIGVW
ncbi:synaptonemal complex protein 1 isoform X3 [Cannabis sativa]|nr:synaptonemal complex protein 1 isoform X3 [Cannabis sativa]XP_030494337.2 synaptonemal complex protein 1 isoform X3 [Cannabis sativa]